MNEEQAFREMIKADNAWEKAANKVHDLRSQIVTTFSSTGELRWPDRTLDYTGMTELETAETYVKEKLKQFNQAFGEWAQLRFD